MVPSRDRHAAARARVRPAVAAFPVALLAALALGEATAPAQQVSGFAVDRFEPPGPDSQWISQESLLFDGHLRPSASLVSDWAWKPLVVYDDRDGEVAPLVRQQLVGHLQAGVVLWNRARADVDLPVPLAHTGSAADIDGRSYGGPQGAGVGDLRIGAALRLLAHARSGVRLALGAQVFLPTGAARAFSSDGGVRFWPRVLAAGDRGRLAWAAQVGLHLRPRHACQCDLSPGSELTAGLAAGWRISRRWTAGPELYLSTAVAGGPFASRAATPVELMLAAHVAVTPRWTVSAGVAPGLSDGAGAPLVRAVAGVQYVLGPPPARVLPDAPPAWPEVVP